MSDREETKTVAAETADPNADRRDSARIPMRLHVREPALGGSYTVHDGNLAIGGVLYWALHPPVGGRVEIRFFIPTFNREARARLPDGREVKRGGAPRRELLRTLPAAARAVRGRAWAPSSGFEVGAAVL